MLRYVILSLLILIGVDKGGECAMVSHKFKVDVTPPTSGELVAGPFDGMVGYNFYLI